MIPNVSGDLSPAMRRKYEAIHTFDPYDSLLVELNQSFHVSYNTLIHEATQLLGKRGHPVIILLRDHVTLLRNGEMSSAVIIPDLYHRLKAISHISFGVFLTLRDNGCVPLREDKRVEMEHQRDLIVSALAILDQEPIPPEYMDIQRRTLNSALEVLQDTLDRGAVEEKQFYEFGELSAPLYLDNAALCVDLELDVLHDVVTRWHDEMGPEEWERLMVVICANHQARYREATKQYFLRLMGEEESLGADHELRVLYGEHIAELDEALDLLARHMVDRRASRELFNSQTRLQRDLMADAATEYLDQLFAK